jgi:ribosomal protein S18 acetylase RimI-like enzyme
MRSPNVIKLDYKNKEHRNAAADLHAKLLPESLVPGLGRHFMTGFYYNRLIKDDLVRCDLYKCKDQFVGWILYTKHPFTFMDEGKRRNFFFLGLILMWSLLTKPSRIKVFLELNRFVAIRSPEKIGRAGAGEFLSFGVLEDFRDVRDESTGLKISKLLFERVLDEMKDEEYNKMLLFVGRKNKAALRFYDRYQAFEIAAGNETEVVMAIDLKSARW